MKKDGVGAVEDPSVSLSILVWSTHRISLTLQVQDSWISCVSTRLPRHLSQEKESYENTSYDYLKVTQSIH
jgi:hypothetical protein